jgi:GNAT superfamily N-acetyltransferase
VRRVKELHLPDGTPAMVWSLSPNDARGLKENYRQLSPEARYSRFLTGVSDLSDDMLRRLVDEVDGVNHVALVLVVFPEDGPDRAVGIGRIVRMRDRPAAADVAVTVDDAWRRRGIGTALLEELLRQKPAGVTELITHVAAGNKGSLALLARAGEVHLSALNGGRYDVRVKLGAAAR